MVYPDWKYKLQMYLGREIESGAETEYIWRLYDLRFHPEDAARKLRQVLGLSGLFRPSTVVFGSRM